MKTLTKIIIQNIVTAFSFEPPLDLERIRKAFPSECFFETLEDRRYTFRVVAIRTKEPNFTFLIYRTGKIVCTGSKSIPDAECSDKYLLSRFQEAGIKTKLKTSAKIQNIVATTYSKNPLDLEKFILKLQQDKNFRIIYEPEQFPASIIKFLLNKENEATILLFSSGKLVCVGLKTVEQTQEAIRRINSKLSKLI